MFSLRAYLILTFGDMPAMLMVMRMKGHNGIFSCRMCLIKEIRIPGSRGGTHYVSLDRSRHPDIQHSATKIKKYNSGKLPLRTHAEFMAHARQAQFADSTAEEERIAKSTGIKGIPLLSYLGSIFFPVSFPLDFMHLIFKNLLKNLVLLWTGNFKDLDEGTGGPVIMSYIHRYGKPSVKPLPLQAQPFHQPMVHGLRMLPKTSRRLLKTPGHFGHFISGRSYFEGGSKAHVNVGRRIRMTFITLHVTCHTAKMYMMLHSQRKYIPIPITN